MKPNSILIFLLMLFYSNWSLAGKVEVKNGDKVSFYEGNGNSFEIDKNVRCKGSLKSDIVIIACNIHGTEVETSGFCDPSNGFGAGILHITTTQGKYLRVIHHCNGLSIK